MPVAGYSETWCEIMLKTKDDTGTNKNTFNMIKVNSH